MRPGSDAAPRPTGICLRDLPTTPSTPAELMVAAAAAGVDLIHLPSPAWVSPTLDDTALRSAAAAFATAGLSVAVGLGEQLNPALCAAAGTDDADRDGSVRRERLVRAAVALGATSVHLTVGTVQERIAGAVSWAEQLAAATAELAALGPLCADAGMQLVLKTHEEMTTREVLAVAEQAGEHVRIGYSPVNVLVCLEDPVTAAVRIAGRVHTVFLDDAAVAWTPQGLVRRMRPVGDGAIDWTAVLEALPGQLPLVLDLHRGEFDMPCYQPDWAAHRPGVTIADAVAVAALATADAPSTALDERRSVGAVRLAGYATPVAA